MHCDLWLAQPKTETRLRTILRTAGVAFAVWALTVAFGLWTTRSAANREQAALAARSQQLSTLSDSMAGKRADVTRAGRVQTASPEGAGSAEFTIELSALAQTSGAELTGVQIGSDDKAGAAPAAAAADKAKAGDNWQQESFECNTYGQYAALSRFLDGMTNSRRVLEFRTIEIAPADAKTTMDAPDLQMKLSGVVYGLPEKP